MYVLVDYNASSKFKTALYLNVQFLHKAIAPDTKRLPRLSY